MTAGVAGICGLVVVLAVAVLASGAGASTLAVPIGPPGASMHLALDPLAASFLLLLFLVMPCAETAPLPLAAVAITVLAGDGFTLAVGLLLLGGVRSLRFTAAAAVCLTVAFALAGPGEFAALRAMPPEGWSAAAVLLLVLVAAGAMSRVSPVIAGISGASGAVRPLRRGAAAVVGCAVAAGGCRHRRDRIAARGARGYAARGGCRSVRCICSGWRTMALGVALFARAVDLPSVASQALDAAWLALVGHVLCRTLLLRCADAAESGAGTRRLDRLGGLIHRMPVTAGSCLVGLFAIAVLPPGLGFAAFWLLFQSLLAAARIGDLGLQVLIVGVAALAALSVGLAALAAVRLFGVAFLGVPRTPRAAVADDAPRPVRIVLGGLAAATALLGLLPGLALLPAAGWTRATGSMALLVLRTGAETPGYSPVAVAGLLAVAGLVAMWVIAPHRRTATRAGVVRRFRRTAVMAAVRRSGDAVSGLLPSPRRCGAFWPCRRRLLRSVIASVVAAMRCCGCGGVGGAAAWS